MWVYGGGAVALLSVLPSRVIPVGEQCFLLPPWRSSFLVGDVDSGWTRPPVSPALAGGRGSMRGRLPPLPCFLVLFLVFPGFVPRISLIIFSHFFLAKKWRPPPLARVARLPCNPLLETVFLCEKEIFFN